VGIAQRLHDETKSLHTAAERSGVMQELLRGTISAASYAVLLSSLRAIYTALEQGLREHAGDPVFAGLDASAFARTAALESDLKALVGDRETWPAPHAVAVTYAAHLAARSRTRPVLLLAHAWLRYLGDLNGGQILARLIRSHESLAALPTGFYAFPGLTDPRAAAGAWRAALDVAPLSADDHDALVAEAQDGFRRHITLFEGLATAPAQVPVPSPSA
jgi:heme oxygenase (biliverdin-producing, ferredoxin)